MSNKFVCEHSTANSASTTVLIQIDHVLHVRSDKTVST